MRWLIWPIGSSPWLLAAALIAGPAPVGDDAGATPASPIPSSRTPWTTSRVVGSPEPPRPYVVEAAFPGLTFDRPLDLVFVPETDLLAVAQIDGKVLTFPNDPGAEAAALMLDLGALHPRFGALYGLAFHPDFERNGRVFVCYTVGNELDDGTRVSEFRVDRRDPPRADPSSERVLLTWYSGGHNGGALKFGPEDGFLYISSGDGAAPSPPDPFLAGQDMTTLLSKVLRIDVDGQDPGLPYRIPPDNPYVTLEGARPEIWAFGFRNPWRMSFDRQTGALWLGDVGWELWELVHLIERGGNYGWSLREGSQPVLPDGPKGPAPITPPVVEHPHSEAASVTGGFVYRGSRFPELEGAYVYGDFQTGTIWGLWADGRSVTRHEVLAETPLRLVAFGEDRDGELLLLDYEQTNMIYRFVPNPDAGRANRRFPLLLSETGLFSSVADHEPAPGVLAYEINAPFWDDGTMADRLMAVPGRDRIGFDRDRLWTFPEGSVFARTVSVDLSPGNRRRVETQVLHLEDGSWRAYSYRWNDEQTDATLVPPEGETVSIAVADPSSPGGSRTITRRIAPRSECALCHNPWAGEGLLFGRQSATPLTANTLQMNVAGGPDCRSAHQLRRLERLGYFADPLPEPPEALPRLANPADEAADLDARARSYLQVNCAHCHRFGAGGSAAIWLTADREIGETGTIAALPMQGSFGIADARIIDPGDPFRSVLYFRMAKLGAGRMPRVGPSQVDPLGIDLIYRWISHLGDDGRPSAPADPFAQLPSEIADAIELLCLGASASPEERLDACRRATTEIRGAMALLRRIDEGAVPDPVVDQIVALTREHPIAEVRDLFERLVPESDRVRRLGDHFDPDALLALAGDPDRGRLVFESNASQCTNCHRIGGRGKAVGPDLDGIGAKYPDRRQLLDHIVDPSKVIDPAYVSYILETVEGVIHSGVVLEQTDEVVVLRDAENQTIRVDASQIELLAPQPRSLMPERLLSSLTEREVADLLSYLAAQRSPAP
ncbi:PQQ-dependent sugar dehydrogenase [Tautonia sociabilis]|nr:PQQ-dependent sugar dehydrogenase [Tautonia sociabilis]